MEEYVEMSTGMEQVEAKILIIRRIVLSLAPILFCLLAASIIFRFDRRGKGFGITAALVCLITYFLLTFAGEQLARSGTIGVILGGLLPVFAVIAAILWLNLAPRGEMFRGMS